MDSFSLPPCAFEEITKVCKYGNITDIVEIIDKNLENTYNLECIMFGCCSRPYNELITNKLINMLVTNGFGNFSIGLHGACHGGNVEAARLMIEKGATELLIGLALACEYGHIEVVHVLIENGVDFWNSGLRHACTGGHLDIAKLMIERGAHDINTGLCFACNGGSKGCKSDRGIKQLQMVKFLESVGGDHWIGAFIKAKTSVCINLYLVRYILNKCRDIYHYKYINSLYNKQVNDIRLYGLYCDYVTIDRSCDKKFNTLLQLYPPYVVLVHGISEKTRTSECTVKKHCLSKLPVELHRLLHECFYNFAVDTN